MTAHVNDSCKRVHVMSAYMYGTHTFVHVKYRFQSHVAAVSSAKECMK